MKALTDAQVHDLVRAIDQWAADERQRRYMDAQRWLTFRSVPAPRRATECYARSAEAQQAGAMA